MLFAKEAAGVLMKPGTLQAIARGWGVLPPLSSLPRSPPPPPFLPTSRSAKEKRKFADAMGTVMGNASKAAANGVRSRGMQERVCVEEE